MSSRFPSPDAPFSTVCDTSIAFAPTITPDTYQDQVSVVDYPLCKPEMSSVDLDAHRPSSSRRKPVDHIPRPPNAFILFRSAFIKSQRVTSGVETSHSTLSKIIGLTWQQLSNEERQKWHMEARIEQEAHKRKYPQYSFRPIHNRLRGPHAERRKLRETGTKDQKRCEKIAELLACGKKGPELEDAVKEFDKHHVPNVVTRFEEPITASSFSKSTSICRGPSPPSTRSRRSATPSSRGQGRPGTSRPAVHTPSPVPQIDLEDQLSTTTEPLSFDTNSFFPNVPHSFEIDNFAFSIREPSPTITINESGLTPVVNNAFDLGTGRNSALLCQRYSHVEDWAPPCSPISTNSTGSLPTTPAPISVPEQTLYIQQNSYPSLTGEPVQKYYTPQGYLQYSEYQTYAHHTMSPQPDSCKKTRSGDPSSCFLANVNTEGPHNTQTPIARHGEDLDFTMFLASLHPSYQL